jgi:hypothetical protein
MLISNGTAAEPALQVRAHFRIKIRQQTVSPLGASAAWGL